MTISSFKSRISALIVQSVYRGLPVLFLTLATLVASPSDALATLHGESLLPKIQQTSHPQKTLESAVANVRSADDLVLLYKNLAKIKDPQAPLEEALAAVDFLAPLRDPKNPWSNGDIAKIKATLEVQVDSEGPVDWQGLKLGLTLIEDPSQAKTILWDLLKTYKGLSNKFSWYESPLHRSFIVSIENLPKSLRDSLMADLMTLRGERLKEFKKGVYKDHAEEANAKLGVRDIQFLQTLLVRADFTAMLKTLNTLYKTSGVNDEFLATLEKYLLKLRLDQSSYSIKKVLETAQGIQSTLRTWFAKNDTAEMFGSFPNMNAKLESTDIDVVFSDKLDEAVRTYIKPGGMSSNDSFTVEEVQKMSADGKKLAADLAEMEQEIAKALGVSKPQGTLLGPLVLPMVQTDKGLVPRMSRLEVMRFLTVISSVTVVVSQKQITLRIYDSVSPAPNAPPVIYDFALP